MSQAPQNRLVVYCSRGEVRWNAKAKNPLIIHQYFCQHIPLKNRYTNQKRTLLAAAGDEYHDDDEQNPLAIYVDGDYISNFNGKTTADTLYKTFSEIKRYNPLLVNLFIGDIKYQIMMKQN